MNRNAPCHCGSGKRYKHCHGLVSTDASNDRGAASTPDTGSIDAVALNARGVEAAQRGQLAQAIDFFTRALAATPESIEVNLNVGTALFQSGRAHESLAFLDKAFTGDPRNPQVLHLRACALAQLGRPREALNDFEALAAIVGNDAALLINRGNCLVMLGQYTQALASFDEVLAQEPCNPGALVGRSDALHKLDRHHEALTAADEALAVNPMLAEALNNRGNALLALQKPADALASYDRALALNPEFADAHYNRANALLELRRAAEALAAFDHALALRPRYVQAHYNRGNALRQLGRLQEAVASYDEAIVLNPDYAAAHNNRGYALLDMDRLDEAVASFNTAVLLDPDNFEAHGNLAIALKAKGRIDEAIASCRRALTVNPAYANGHHILGMVLHDRGEIGAAVESYRQALALDPGSIKALSNLIYLHAFTRDVSPERECEVAATWETVALTEDERIAAREQRATFARAGRQPGAKLKLGFVSAELGQHAVAEFLEPFLERVDRSRFTLTLYPTAARTGARAERIAAFADKVESLFGVPDADAAQRIRADAIDVLVDTTSHMAFSRLGIFARRAAPVQCHYIGYHGTTGLTEMDWFIGDDTLLPQSCNAHFREKIWRLPRLWVAYRGDTTLTESRWTPSSAGIVTFGSFNNLAKVRQESLSLWARVMLNVPGSRLLLKDRQAGDAGVRARILSALAKHGVDGARVEFIEWTPDWQSHMALYDRLDIALDPIPLNSGTTAFDALWMGVPLVGVEGDWMGGRMTTAILRALGRPEWVVRNEDEYVACVTALARDVAGRARLRAGQRALMAKSPLCDCAELARVLENAFESMFDQRAANRQAPV